MIRLIAFSDYRHDSAKLIQVSLALTAPIIRLICLIRREKSGRRLTTSPVSHEKLFTSLNTNTINETYSFTFNNIFVIEEGGRSREEGDMLSCITLEFHFLS